MIVQPFRQCLTIGNDGFAETEYGANFGAVAFERTVAHVEHIERHNRYVNLSRDSSNGFRFNLRGMVWKAAMNAIEEQ